MNFPIQLVWVKFMAGFGNIQDRISGKWLEMGVSLLIISGIFWGGYEVFYRGAIFLQNQGEIGTILLDRIFYLAWSIIFYLLVLSNIITSFSTLYRSDEVIFFLTLPLRYVRIFQIKFIETMIYSSWSILILGLPLIIAYGRVQNQPLSNLILIMFTGMLPTLILATGIGMIIIMLVIRGGPHRLPVRSRRGHFI